MQFTKKFNAAEEGEAEALGYIKYFKLPVTTFRILQDPEDWEEYWEHFNPGGYPFPCTGDRNACPGCTSENEKMKKASKRVAINVLEGEYVNVYKFPKTVADKLANRAERIGTVMDRDYTIYRNQEKNADGSMRTDYDIEGGDREPFDKSKLDRLKDINTMLAEAYDQSWGNGKVEEVAVDQPKEPPFESGPYDEAELRKKSVNELMKIVKQEKMTLPSLKIDWDTDSLVDWMIDNS